MKFVKFLLIALLFAMVCVPRAKCQVRPNEFPEETNPTSENFETYSQKGGVNRRASLGNLKRYFTPVVFGVIGYIPTPSGNASNRMEFVTDPNGDRWFIDATGKATQLGKSYTGGAGITITGATIAAADPSATNELVTGFGITGSLLRLTQPGGGFDVALTSIAPDQSATNEIQRFDTLAVVGGNLRVSLLNDGVPFSSVTLPVADGSETKLNSGTGTTVTGLGTTASPYVVNATDPSVSNELVTTFDINSGNLRLTEAGTTRTVPVVSIAPDQSTTNEIQRFDTLAVVGGNLRVSLLNDGVPFSSVTLPVADGSETRLNSGMGTTVTGLGTTASPYVVNNTGDTNAIDDITTATSAAGDLTGNYPSPTVARLQGRAVVSTAPATNQVLKFNGTAWAPGADDNTGTTYSAGSGIGIVGTVISNTGDTNAGDDVTSSTGGTVGYNAVFTAARTVTSGNIFDNGSIGLGTNNPQRTFHMAGFTNNFFRIEGFNNVGIELINSNLNPNATWSTYASTGTNAAPTALSDGKRIGAFVYYGHDGTAYRNSGGMDFVVDGAVTSNNVPTRWDLSTKNANWGVPLTRLTVRSDGKIGANQTNPEAIFHTRGTGATSTTMSFLAENSVGTDAFWVLDNATVGIAGNAGTPTTITGRTSGNLIANVTIGTGLSFTSGTLSNTGDTDATNDITTISTAGGDVSGTFSNLQLINNSVGPIEIIDQAVITAKVADNAITEIKIVDAAISTSKVANGAITLQKLASASVNSNIIANGSVDAIDFASQGATNGQPLIYSSTAPGFVPGTSGGDVTGPYTNLQLAANSVTSAEIADNSVASSEITNGSIQAVDLFFSSYSLGSTVFSDGSQWVYGQQRNFGYTDTNSGGGTGSITLSGNRVDNLLRGSNWTSLTINMPNSPTDGQMSTLISDVAATSVTWSGNGNTLQGTLPSSIAVGDFFAFKFYSANSKWMRVN